MRDHAKLRACVALLLFVLTAGTGYSQNTRRNQKLQEAVNRAMNGQAGAAVVADVLTGEILAAYGMETAAQRTERPGSTVKPFVLLALLEAGKVDANEKLLCRRTLRIAGVKMDCTHPASVTELDAERIGERRGQRPD
jgi:cell division protein FtsI/penicillin-binding protein 2